jgi:hypothetical protein
MRVSVQKAIIDINMVLKPSKQLWAWEVPVVQEKFGGGKVRLLDTVEVERESLPDAADEFARLGIAHGADGGDGGTNVSYVEMAYGRGRAGIMALQQAIEASEIGVKPKGKPGRKKKTAAKVEPTEPPVEVDEGDPLADG